MNRPILLSLLLAVAATIHSASAQAQAASPKAAPNQAPQQLAQAQVQANPITQFAAKSGVNKCLNKINQVTNFVGQGGQSGALVFAAPKEVDRQLATISLEVEKPSSLSYVSASFAPGPGNECGATYDEVTYWSNSCPDVAGKVFNAFKRSNPLKTTIAIRENGPTVKVYFMPAGPGCVVIKKEMVF